MSCYAPYGTSGAPLRSGDSGIPMGPVVQSSVMITAANASGDIASLVGALVVLPAFTVLLLVVLRRQRRRSQLVATMDEYSLTQTVSVSIASSLDTTLQIIQQSLASIGARDIATHDSTVVATTPMTGRTFGQRVEVVVHAGSDNASCEAICRSWPKVDYTTRDWGAGRIVPNQLFSAIQTEAARAELSEPTRQG